MDAWAAAADDAPAQRLHREELALADGRRLTLYSTRTAPPTCAPAIGELASADMQSD